MDYESAKELLKKEMVLKNYSNDSQSRFFRVLRGLCDCSNKFEKVENLDYLDVEEYLDYLKIKKHFKDSSIKSYLSAIKFIFAIVLERVWNNESFPGLTIKRNREGDSVYSNNLVNKLSYGKLSFGEVLQLLIVEMEIRGFATGTQGTYLRCNKRFLEFSGKENHAETLTIDDVRNFLYNLQMVRRFDAQTINIYNSAAKFLFVNVLDKPWDDNKVPHLKIHKSVPIVLSKDEVLKLINAIVDDTYRMIVMLMYSSGLRIGEAIKLRVTDIDSKNMQLHICNCKGNKDRYAILSGKCLRELRNYYRIYKPTNYLFEGRMHNEYISKESVESAIRVAVIKCGFRKKVTAHTLRHCFATHLMENGVSIYAIKQLLGHKSINSSSRYLETVNFTNMNVQSPLDTLGGI